MWAQKNLKRRHIKGYGMCHVMKHATQLVDGPIRDEILLFWNAGLSSLKVTATFSIFWWHMVLLVINFDYVCSLWAFEKSFRHLWSLTPRMAVYANNLISGRKQINQISHLFPYEKQVIRFLKTIPTILASKTVDMIYTFYILTTINSIYGFPCFNILSCHSFN